MCAYYFTEFLVLHSVTAQQRHIVGGGVVVIVVQAVGFYKVGAVHADFGALAFISFENSSWLPDI